jgi:hypothetical protein
VTKAAATFLVFLSAAPFRGEMTSARNVALAAVMAVSVLSASRVGAAAGAEDYLTDRDLRAAYCVGVGDGTLSEFDSSLAAMGQSYPSEETRKPISDAYQQKRLHLVQFLMARGYFDRKDFLSVLPALKRGKEDAIRFQKSNQLCLPRCPFPAPPRPNPSGAELKRFNAAREAGDDCRNACQSAAGLSGLAKKLEDTCGNIEKELPF